MEKRPGETRTCLTCGKSFHLHPYKLRLRPTDYCCRACRPPRRTGETRACIICGTEFYIYPSALLQPHRTGEFCSKKCYGVRVGNRTRGIPLTAETKRKLSENRTNRGVGIPRKPPIERMCIECGVVFVIPRSTPARLRAKRRYCTRACWYVYLRREPVASPSFRGGESATLYGPNWRDQNMAARVRDAHTCRDCGITGEPLDVHHVIPRREFEPDDYAAMNALTNLVTVCKHCHATRERSLDAAYQA